MWIFGYGSLIWRPSFPFLERRAATLAGYSRRFWQGSTDHRGVPGAPGRVVTLVKDANGSVWGAAYRVEEATYDAVLATLDVREQGGYERHELPVTTTEGETLQALVYLAGPDNREYLGPAPIEEIAAQIAGAHGPSGANTDYVLELARSLEEAGVADAHVEELARAVRAISARS